MLLSNPKEGTSRKFEELIQRAQGQNNHSIDFNYACVIDKGNYRIPKTLESWHTAKTAVVENN